MRNFSLFAKAVLFGVAVLMLAGCGGDDDGDILTTDFDLTDAWDVTEVADETDCGDGINTYNYSATITQNGTRLSVTIDGSNFTGSIVGNSVSWTGSFP